MARHNKGSQYERSTCRLLSEWWSGGRSDSIFWRVKASGGRATIRARKGKSTDNQHGDLYAVESSGLPLTELLVIELKRGYSKDTIQNLIDRPKGTAQQRYDQFFQQVITSWNNAAVFSWVLIVKRDKREALIYMPQELVKALKENGAWSSKPVPFATFLVDVRFLEGNKIRDIPMRISCMTLKQFLICVTPKMIREIGKWY